ncbi:MAG: YqaJ viral recombinase family protein [Blautia obeum]
MLPAGSWKKLVKVRRANAIFYKEEQPFMLANVDRLIVGENAGLGVRQHLRILLINGKTDIQIL